MSIKEGSLNAPTMPQIGPAVICELEKAGANKIRTVVLSIIVECIYLSFWFQTLPATPSNNRSEQHLKNRTDFSSGPTIEPPGGTRNT